MSSRARGPRSIELLGSGASSGVPGGRIVAAIAASLALLLLMVAVGTAGSVGATDACEGTKPSIELGNVGGLPPEARVFVRLYLGAAERFELGERGPAILASIHRVESRFGELNTVTSTAGAVGHMQFLPSTFAAYAVDGDGDGETNPYDPADAIYTAANYLRALGAPEDWYSAIFGYNHADWYVDEVLTGAEAFADVGAVADATTVECSGPELAGGPAELSEAVRVYEPRVYATVPAKWGAYGQAEQFDARLIDNLVWVLDTYHLRLIQGRSDPGSPSKSHGHGTAADMAPQPGYSWDETALRLAEDLGWTRECGGSGERPACDLVPAIANVYYDGFSGHGEGNHIHVGWACACTYGSDTLAPTGWVMVFPSPSEASEDEVASSGSEDDVNALVVGDSLTVGTRPFLKRRLEDQVTVDAEGGRTSSGGLEVLRRELDASDPEIVVFDLGTNDDPGRAGALTANLRAARERTGHRCLIVATLHRPGGGPINSAIREFAAEAPNTVLFDWHELASAASFADAIHPTRDGYRLRAAGEIAAMQAC